MSKLDSITIEVKLGVSDETAASCITILNEWLKEIENRVVVKERENGTVYIEPIPITIVNNGMEAT